MLDELKLEIVLLVGEKVKFPNANCAGKLTSELYHFGWSHYYDTYPPPSAQLIWFGCWAYIPEFYTFAIECYPRSFCRM